MVSLPCTALPYKAIIAPLFGAGQVKNPAIYGNGTFCYRRAMKLLDTQQAAKILRRPERTVRHWCEAGLLGQNIAPKTSQRKRWVITEQELARFKPPTKGRPRNH